MGKKAPKAPDPWQTASAQGAWNTFTAQQQQQMNMIGQNTPWGTLDYAQTGSTWITDPNGKRVEIPTYTANVALTPEQQAIFERTQEAETNLAQIAADQSARVGEILNTPFEFTNRDAETWAYDLASPRILQQQQQNEQALRTQLINSGLRPGTSAWNYGITNAASAMTAAQSGSFQEDHAGTARLWDEQIASRGLAMAPFNWRVSNLVEKTYRAEVNALRNGSIGKLLTRPAAKDDALGAAAGYLSGSAKWYAWKTEEDLKRNRAFKDLGVDSFRSKAARALRDEWLERKPVGFVHQAARYRGKANYREALFLAYGSGTETILAGYVEDMHAVLKAFLAMAGAFARRKLGKDLWSEFVADVDVKKAFTTRAGGIWG